MTPKELQEQWLKNNKPKVSIEEDKYLSKDGFGRSRKTYDELHQDKKVIATNAQGKVTIHNSKLDDEALQTLKNYKLEDYKYIGLYVSKVVRECRTYLKILSTKDFIIKGKIKTMYKLEDNTYITHKSLINRNVFKKTNKSFHPFVRVEHSEITNDRTI